MSETLTGRRRFRTSFFGRIVLQVETTNEYVDPLDGRVSIWANWRDARASDFTTLPELATVE